MPPTQKMGLKKLLTEIGGETKNSETHLQGHFLGVIKCI